MALATSVPLTESDQLLVPALRRHGVHATDAIWSNPAEDWRGYDAVTIRSCWDYHLRPVEFAAWLNRIERLGLQVINSPSLSRWNASKHYLMTLAEAGVATPRTVVLPAGTGPSDWLRGVDGIAPALVIKPAISASAYRTWRASAPLDPAAVDRLSAMLASGDVLVQEYLPEIAEGEVSLIFLDGVFSHAILKLPADGDFRVQSEHGGSARPVTPADEAIRRATQVLGALPEVPTFARIDMVRRGADYLLMEAELIDPELFLHLAPGSANRLAAAIASRTSSRPA